MLQRPCNHAFVIGLNRHQFLVGGTYVGYEGEGAVVCGAAVDTAIDAMIVNVARWLKVCWPSVLERGICV